MKKQIKIDMNSHTTMPPSKPPALTVDDLQPSGSWWLPHMAESINYDVIAEENGRGYVVRMGPAAKDWGLQWWAIRLLNWLQW